MLRKTLLLFLIITLLIIYFKNLEVKIPKIFLKKLNTNHFELIVQDKPFIIKGVCYNPTPVGKGPEYDLFIDKTEPWRIDGKLMKDIGVNTVFYI